MRTALLALMGLSSAALGADFHAVAVDKSWGPDGKLRGQMTMNIYYRNDGSRAESWEVVDQFGRKHPTVGQIWNVPARKLWGLSPANPPDVADTVDIDPLAIAQKHTRHLWVPGSNPAKGICTPNQDKAEHGTLLGYDVVLNVLGQSPGGRGDIQRTWLAPDLDCEPLQRESVFVDPTTKIERKIQEYSVLEVNPGKQADERFILKPGIRQVPYAHTMTVRP